MDGDAEEGPESGVLSSAAFQSLVRERERRFERSSPSIQQEGNRIQLFIFYVAVASVLLNVATIAVNRSISDSTKMIGDLTRAQIRPFLEISRVQTPGGDKGAASDFSIEIKNYGLTPAVELLTYGQAVLSHIDDQGHVSPGVTYFTKCIEEESINPGFLANGNVSWAPLIKSEGARHQIDKFTDKSWEEFGKGQSILILIGEICYKDLFRVQHFTKFCFFLRDRSALFNSPTYSTCKKENEFDWNMSSYN